MNGNAKEEITIPPEKEEIHVETPIYSVNPNGRIFPFYCLCRCFGKRKKLQDGKYYDVFCNEFVYTTDGRMFIGNYIPGEDVYEDLDPVVMIPADYIFCCGFCCPDLYFDWFHKQAEDWIEDNLITMEKNKKTEFESNAPSTVNISSGPQKHRNQTRKKKRYP